MRFIGGITPALLALNPSIRIGCRGRRRPLARINSFICKNAATRLYQQRREDSSRESSREEPSSSTTTTATTTTAPTTSVVHFNHAGASPSPASVVDIVLDHMRIEQTLGGYTAAEMASNKLQTVYERVAQLLHLGSGSGIEEDDVADNKDFHKKNNDPRLEIALVESATVAWTRLFYSMVDYQNKNKIFRRNHRRQQQQIGINEQSTNDQPLVILISEAEYAANVVAACQWANDHSPSASSSSSSSWTVLSIPSTTTQEGKSTGMVDLRILQQMLEGKYQYHHVSAAPFEKKDDDDDSKSSNTCSTTTTLLDPANIAMVCITHIPTNSGIVNDVEGIGRLIAQFNNNNNNNNQQEEEDQQEDNNTSSNTSMPSILYLVDACQSIGQRHVDVTKIQCHGLVATGRKFLRGPRGTGFLYVPQTIADQLIPHHIDHYGCPVVQVPTSTVMTDDDNNDDEVLDKNRRKNGIGIGIETILQIQPKVGAARFEFYESNIANKLGLGEAIRYAIEEEKDDDKQQQQQQQQNPGGIDQIQTVGLRLAQQLYQRLEAKAPLIRTHHPPLCGIVTFYVPNVPSSIIKQRLWETKKNSNNSNSGDHLQFETSLVPATSTPLDSCKTGVPDMVRVSLSYTNSVEEIKAFCDKLESLLQELC